MGDYFKTSYILQQIGYNSWELKRDHSHGKTTPLTTLTAVLPEVAMTRADIWLHVRGYNHHRGYWTRSRGYTNRWVYRTSCDPASNGADDERETTQSRDSRRAAQDDSTEPLRAAGRS